MNYKYLLAFTLLLSFLIFLIQRTESGKRRLVILITIVPAELIRRWADYREANTELVMALILSVVLNLLFWLLIGRYNPVASSDKIKVLKLDD